MKQDNGWEGHDQDTRYGTIHRGKTCLDVVLAEPVGEVCQEYGQYRQMSSKSCLMLEISEDSSMSLG